MKPRRALFAGCLAAAVLSLPGCSGGADARLLDPPSLNEPAPERYRVLFDTSKGPFTVDVNREWAPAGADRLYNLVKNGFFDETRFFRVVPGFVVQFGIHGQPEVAEAWNNANIGDDQVRQSNRRGMVTFATAGPNTRTTQLFINLADNSRLDGMGFSPVGQVTDGMSVVDQLFSGYGEGYPNGNGPDQNMIRSVGNRYLEAQFPKLDYVKTARIAE